MQNLCPFHTEIAAVAQSGLHREKKGVHTGWAQDQVGGSLMVEAGRQGGTAMAVEKGKGALGGGLGSGYE